MTLKQNQFAPTERAGMKTLIVEDDFTNRILLQAFLSRYGECHTAVNGAEALTAFEMANAEDGIVPYDLVCMDMLMPGMNGKDAVRHIRATEETRGILSNKGTKIIMTTSVRDMKDIVESFHALCDAYLFKPVDTQKLLGHLQEFGLV